MPDYRNAAIRQADRKFRIRVKFAIPNGGLGSTANELHAWLDSRLGRDGYFVTPADWQGYGQASAVHLERW
jgi:hypothetical protein